MSVRTYYSIGVTNYPTDTLADFETQLDLPLTYMVDDRDATVTVDKNGGVHITRGRPNSVVYDRVYLPPSIVRYVRTQTQIDHTN